MTLREFWRYHLLKVLLILVALQIGIIAFFQNFNHKPVATRDTTIVVENNTLKISPLTNDGDKDEETDLSIAAINQPLQGKVEQNGILIIYTPNPGYFGVDSFAYAISDGKKTSDFAYVKVQVLENLPPRTFADTSLVYEGKTTSIDVTGNDLDKEGDSLLITKYNEPVNGKIIKRGNKFIYTPNPGFKGIDRFTYNVSDGKSESDNVPVTIQVLPKSALLYPWLTTDIGNAAIKGQTTKSGNNYTLTGSGADIWQNEDGFRYAYQYVQGDCEMVAKVESLEGSHEWAKAGIMIREELSGGAKHSMVVLSNSNGATVHHRQGPNEYTIGTEKNEAVAPYWVKIKRKSDTFICSISKDGATWNTLAELENPMAKNVFIGMVCTSHNNKELATAVYSHIKLKSHPVKY